MRVFGLLILVMAMSITGSSQTQTSLLEREEFADLREAMKKYEERVLIGKAAEEAQVREVGIESFLLDDDAVGVVQQAARKVCSSDPIGIWVTALRLADAQARVKIAKKKLEEAEERLKKAETQIKEDEQQGTYSQENWEIFGGAELAYRWAPTVHANSLKDVAEYTKLLNEGLGDCIAGCKQ